MVGGDLHWIWKPYEIYQEVDLVSRPSVMVLFVIVTESALDRYTVLKPSKTTTGSQTPKVNYPTTPVTYPNTFFTALLNVIETLMNLSYVYLAHVSAWSAAPLVGFAAATMTLSKTVLYWLQEYYCGGCATGHNSFEDLLVYWIIPNGCVCVFGVRRCPAARSLYLMTVAHELRGDVDSG